MTYYLAKGKSVPLTTFHGSQDHWHIYRRTSELLEKHQQRCTEVTLEVSGVLDRSNSFPKTRTILDWSAVATEWPAVRQVTSGCARIKGTTLTERLMVRTIPTALYWFARTNSAHSLLEASRIKLRETIKNTRIRLQRSRISSFARNVQITLVCCWIHNWIVWLIWQKRCPSICTLGASLSKLKFTWKIVLVFACPWPAKIQTRSSQWVRTMKRQAGLTSWLSSEKFFI